MTKGIHFIAILSIIFSPLVLHAQAGKQGYITGVVCDSALMPIESAMATLATPVGIHVATRITDPNGCFKFDTIPVGKYTILITHLSYSNYLNEITVEDSLALGVIALKLNPVSINPVTVLASRVVYNAGGYSIAMLDNPIAKGKNASEALAFLPYVSSEDGTFQILGQAVGKIRINGVVITDPKELEAIQAENLDNIEIVFFGKHGEFGSGGEINIKLKKPATGGYYGSITGESSVYFKYGHTNDYLNSSVYYGNKKWNIYNYSYGSRDKEISDDKYEIFYKDSDKHRHTKSEKRSPISFFVDRLSIMYDLNEHHTIGMSLRYSRSRLLPKYSSLSEWIDGNISKRDGSANSENKITCQYQASLKYTWLLDDKKSSFKLTGDYLRYKTDTDGEYEYLYQIGQTNQYTDFAKNKIDNKVDMYYAKAAFNIKTGQKGNLEFGVNYNNNRTRQLLDYRDLENDSWSVNPDQSDNYKLKGDHYLGFVAFSSEIGNKVIYEVSTQFEHRKMGYNSIKIGQGNKKVFNTIDFKANLTYFINKEKGDILRFSYGRWVKDLPYSAISPVVTYINEYSYSRGNLNLTPCVINRWSLILTLRNKWDFTFSPIIANKELYYRTFIDTQNPLVTYTMPVNDLSSFGFWLNAERTFKIADWWRINVFGAGGWSEKKTPDQTTRSFVFVALVNNTIELKNDMGGTLYSFWKSGTKQPERKYKSERVMNMSVYKYFFDRKLQIALNGVLYRFSPKMIIETNEIQTKHHPRTDYTKIALRVTYNFKGGKKVNIKEVDNSQKYIELKDL